MSNNWTGSRDINTARERCGREGRRKNRTITARCQLIGFELYHAKITMHLPVEGDHSKWDYKPIIWSLRKGTSWNCFSRNNCETFIPFHRLLLVYSSGIIELQFKSNYNFRIRFVRSVEINADWDQQRNMKSHYFRRTGLPRDSVRSPVGVAGRILQTHLSARGWIYTGKRTLGRSSWGNSGLYYILRFYF